MFNFVPAVLATTPVLICIELYISHWTTPMSLIGETCFLGKRRPQHAVKTRETTVGWFCRAFCMWNWLPVRGHDDELIFALRTSEKMIVDNGHGHREVGRHRQRSLTLETQFTQVREKEEIGEAAGWSVPEGNNTKPRYRRRSSCHASVAIETVTPLWTYTAITGATAPAEAEA